MEERSSAHYSTHGNIVYAYAGGAGVCGVGVCGYRINLHSSVPTLVANFNMLVKSED